MKNVFFKPWVGLNYPDNCKLKIMVLGDSHICGGCEKCGDLEYTDDSCREMTTNTIKHFLSYKAGEVNHEKWMNTFSRFGNVFMYKTLNHEEHIEFWNSVMFYNFCQFSTNQARKSPTYEEYKDSATAFFEILEEYQPDLIIVWGDRAWKCMPSLEEYSTEIEINGVKGGKIYNYMLKSGLTIPAYKVNHPSSSAFNYSWHPFIQQVIQYTEDKKQRHANMV